MTAKDARTLADSIPKNHDPEKWMKDIYKSIHEEAAKGMMFTTYTFKGKRCPAPNKENERAIWKTLEDEGYKIKRIPLSDHTEISWSE